MEALNPTLSTAPERRHCNGPFQDAVAYAAAGEIAAAVEKALAKVARQYGVSAADVRTWMAWAASEGRSL